MIRNGRRRRSTNEEIKTYYVIFPSALFRKSLLYKTDSSLMWVRKSSAKGTLVFFFLAVSSILTHYSCLAVFRCSQKMLPFFCLCSGVLANTYNKEEIHRCGKRDDIFRHSSASAGPLKT